MTKSEMNPTKRFASHYLFVPEVGFLKQQVVELEKGVAVRYFALTEEIESVEWLPGVIALCCEGDVKWIPYLLYPFDFISMQPVAETQRKQLR